MNEQTYAKWLTDLGPLGLTFALVVAIGYLIRLVPWVANKYIPLLAPVVGGVLLPLIAPAGFVGAAWKNPTVVLVIYGIIVGVVAWVAHALIISRIEDMLASKFPAVGKFFAATADPQPVKPEGRGFSSKPDGLPPFPLWILTGLLALGTTACIVPVKSGSDPVVVQAEQFRIEARRTLDAFIIWVDRNPGLGSDVLAARELAAKEGPLYLRELRTATRTYKQARTPENADAMQARITALRGLLDLVRQHATPKTP